MVETRLHQRGRKTPGLARGILSRLVATALLALAGVVSIALPSRADTSLSMTMSEQQAGYGRIVLGWPGGVPHYTGESTGSVVVISFDKPFAVDVDRFQRELPDYVAVARQDKDHKTLRLALNFQYTLHMQVAEDKIYIDLLPSTWTGASPPLPADVIARLAAAAEARKEAEAEAKLMKERGVTDPSAPQPELAVRAANHDGITRLVFDWNQPVLYSLSQSEGSATITFDRTAKVSLAPIRVNPPPFLKTISAAQHEGRLSIFMKLAQGATVTDFREDLNVVLDIKPFQPARSDADASNGTATPPAKTDAAAAPPPQAHAPLPLVPAAAAATPAAPEEKQAQAAPPPAPEAAVVPAVQPSTAPADPIKVGLHTADGRTEMEFPWTKPVGAAVFVRADMLWIVFDQRAAFDLSEFDADPSGLLGKPMAVEVDRGAALTIPLKDSRLLVNATEEGTSWHVSLGETQASTGRPISLARSWQDTGEGVVTLDLKGARDVIQIRDPVVLDTLLVATARGASQSMQVPRSFIEFEALRTAQGVAIVRIADDLNVAAAPDAIVISRHDGLSLSADAQGGADSLAQGTGVPSPAYMDFARWRGKSDFNDGRAGYLMKIATAADDQRPAIRLAYARFLLAYGLGPEALTQLGMAAAANGKIGDDPSFRALRGAAEHLTGSDAQAVADLSTSALALDPYAAAWRGLARAALGDMSTAHRDFEMAQPVLETFDPEFGARVRVAAAEADLAAQDIAGAKAQLDRLPARLDDRKLAAEALLAQAEILDGLRNTDEAAILYDRAAASGERQVDVRARFEKALMFNKAGKFDDDKLIAELERLRMEWRGDDLERRILSRLAALRLAKGQVVEALGVMRAATVNFPDSDDAHEMGAKMPDIFADYFTGGGADKLPPVQALAFYYSFQDLTPIGQKGDEVIRHLAERLVSVDLLPQAEELLKYQIGQRLTGGVAKAQVAARLASLYLLDQKPQDALNTIRATAQNMLPDDLDRQRRLIEARSLGALKKYDLALDLLTEIAGPQADELRADVLWEAQRWSDAGQAAETLADAAAVTDPLSDEARFEIMRGAIAYSLAGDQGGLDRMRAKFGSRIAATPDASGFAVVTDPIGRSGGAFREIVSRIASVNMMERFVASLKATPPAPAVN